MTSSGSSLIYCIVNSIFYFLIVSVNSQRTERNEIVKVLVVSEDHSAYPIELLNSTPLADKMTFSQQNIPQLPTLRNSVVVRPYQVPGSYLQGTLKRLLAAPIQKSTSAIFSPRFVPSNSAAAMTKNRLLLRSQLQSTPKFESIEQKSQKNFSDVLPIKDKNTILTMGIEKTLTKNFVPLNSAKTIGASERLSRMQKRSNSKMREIYDDAGETMTSLTELEIKSDVELQKALYRTTMRTFDYTKVEPFTTPAPSALPSLTLPFQSVGLSGLGAPQDKQKVGEVLPSVNQFQLPASVQKNATSEQFQQLGCGFDIITQTCKDVFQLGWCQHCTDFGNVFLHDCKCTAFSEMYVNAIAAVASAGAALTANQSALPTFGAVTQAPPFAQQIPLSSSSNDADFSSAFQLPKPKHQSAQPIVLVRVPILVLNPHQNVDQSQIFSDIQHVQATQNNLFPLLPQQQVFNAPSIGQPQVFQQTLTTAVQTAGTSQAFGNLLQPFPAPVLQQQTPTASASKELRQIY